MQRRDFLKTVGIVGSSAMLQPNLVFGAPRQKAAYFGLHPFVAAHREAVFIHATSVSGREASAEKRGAGYQLAGELFFASDTSGFSTASKVAIKPNITCLGGGFSPQRMGIVTDADFVEGLIGGMKDHLGLDGSQFYLREATTSAMPTVQLTRRWIGIARWSNGSVPTSTISIAAG